MRKASLPSAITQRLDELRGLGENRETNELAITDVAIHKAKAALGHAMEVDRDVLSAPSIGALPDGGIVIEWRLATGKEMILEISGESDMGYLLVIPGDNGKEDEFDKEIGTWQELDVALRTLSDRG